MSGEPNTTDASSVIMGHLFVYVAFDWGDEVDLGRARNLAPAQVRALAQRPRTPTSFAYKPPPLRFALEPAALRLPPLGVVRPTAAEATVFDFAAVSVALTVSFNLSFEGLTSLAASLTEPATSGAVVNAAREALAPLYETLKPSVVRPQWNRDLWEEYFVFDLPPGRPLDPDAVLASFAGWTAGLIRLEAGPLSEDEKAEALRLSIRYGKGDVFIADWAAAVLLDDEPGCVETLQTVEFANLQLLEYRHIDDRLDQSLGRAAHLIHGTTRSRLPY